METIKTSDDPNKVKLYFPEEVSCNLSKRITTRIKIDFMKEFKELKEDPEQSKQIDLYKKTAISTDGENPKMNIGDLLELTKIQRTAISPELIEHNDNIYCKLLYIILDKTGLTELQNKALETDEFWDEQDMEEVQKAIMFFRGKIAV